MCVKLTDVSIAYGKATVVRDVSFELQAGEIGALLGHNGAGKTTLLKGIVGLVKPYKGTISLAGVDIQGSPPHRNITRGIYYVGTQNANFRDLSVDTNLELAGHTVRNPGIVEERRNGIFEIFPVLARKKDQKAGTMSGGEKKMLEIGMALMTQPKLLLVDEPSLGLSPVLVERVMECLLDINREFGTSILLVEQNVKQALRVANKACIIKTGRIIAEESSAALARKGHELFGLF